MLVQSNVGGRIYATDGPSTPWPPAPVPGTEYSLPVAGWDRPIDGELLCQSGSVSGTVCGLRNTGVEVSFSAYDPRCKCYELYEDLEMAKRVDGGQAVESGDSGGPVFVPYFSRRAGAWRTIAKGTVTAGGGALGGGPEDRLLYQDFGTAYRQWGVNPTWQP